LLITAIHCFTYFTYKIPQSSSVNILQIVAIALMLSVGWMGLQQQLQPGRRHMASTIIQVERKHTLFGGYFRQVSGGLTMTFLIDKFNPNSMSANLTQI